MQRNTNKVDRITTRGDDLPVEGKIIVEAQDPDQPAKQAEAAVLFNTGSDVLGVAAELLVTPKVAQQWWNDWQLGLAQGKRGRWPRRRK